MARFRVRELAKQQGLSITQLHQKALRLSPDTTLAYNTVSSIWNNRTKRPDLDTLVAIARALGVEPGALISSDPDPEEDVKREPGKEGLRAPEYLAA